MEEGMEIYPMVMFPMLSVRDVGASVGWCSGMLGFGSVFVLPGAGGEPVMAHLRRRGRWVLVQGWSEANWVQPRNEPGAAFADDHYAGAARLAGRRAGVAGGVGAAGRATGDDEEAPPAALTAGRAIAAEGSVQATHGLARARHVEASGAAARAGGGAVPLELAEAAQPGVLPE